MGFSCAGEAELPEVYDYVPKTKSYGNWRHWFLEEDCGIFAEIFHAYLVRYGDSLEWDLNADPLIQAEYCSLYLKRVMRQAREKAALVDQKTTAA